jgi:hypothetical protein
MIDKIQWLGTPESRIISIRKFRKFIDNLPFEKAVMLTQQNWNSGPHINKLHFDISKVDDWPTPWDLFGQSTFCSNSQILGIFYTLLLSEHSKQHNIKLAISEDVIQGEKVNIVFDNYPLDNLNISSIVTKENLKTKLGVI